MPVFVDRTKVAYLGGRMPMILLHDVPTAFDLPPLSTTAGQVAPCAGWVLMASGAMCVVDGPGNLGYLLPIANDAAMDLTTFKEHQLWLAAVDAAGGVVVVAGENTRDIASVEDIVDRTGLRGGFIPAT